MRLENLALKQCPNCHIQLELEETRSRNIECPNCHTMLYRQQGRLKIQTVVCPSCGSVTHPDAAYCPECKVALALDD